MDDSFDESTQFPMWPLPESALRALRDLPNLFPYTLRDTIIPIERRLHPAQIVLTRPSPVVTDRRKRTKQYPGCLAQAVSGMFYSVVANRRQPNLYIIHREGRGRNPNMNDHGSFMTKTKIGKK